jgi:hypothetical protein
MILVFANKVVVNYEILGDVRRWQRPLLTVWSKSATLRRNMLPPVAWEVTSCTRGLLPTHGDGEVSRECRQVCLRNSGLTVPFMESEGNYVLFVWT